MKEFYKEVGERIHFLRVMKGYTREKLAEEASISPKFLYEIETGRKGFSTYVLYRISRALEVKSEYLLTGKDEEDSNPQLNHIIQAFNRKQAEHINGILKHIYELCR